VSGPLFGDPIGPWRPWFAWFPVRTFDDEWVWLRRILRKRYQKKVHLPGALTHWWEYARHGEPL
jgi:hypothetical protein